MLAFIHIEKCGGTTLVHLLRRMFFLEHCDVIPRNRCGMIFTPADLQHLLRLRPKLQSISGHSISANAGLQGVCDISFVTLLRNPLHRYVSDYQHLGKRFLLGRNPNFEEWLGIESRRNFQTRAVAGQPDLAAAKAILTEKIKLVGLVEQYDAFLQDLKLLSREVSGRSLSASYRIKNNRSRIISIRSEREQLLDKFAEQIQEANQLDLQLYDFVRTELIPKQRRSTCSTLGYGRTVIEARNRAWMVEPALSAAQWLFRNLVYKPYVRRLPFKPYALPIYEKRSRMGTGSARRRAA